MELGIISVCVPTLLFLLWKKADMDKRAQRIFDASRKQYELVYPRGTTEQMVLAFLSSLGGGIRRRGLSEVPTLVSEIRWTDKDVKHILWVAPQHYAHVMSMVDAHLPGATVAEVELKELVPTVAVDVRMTDTARMLRINRDNIRTLAVSILHSIQVPDLHPDEVVTYQIVLSHTDGIKLPPDNAAKSKMTATDFWRGNVKADKHEITDRQKKAIEPNFNAAIRISAATWNDGRARQLIGHVLTKLRNAESNDVKLRAPFIVNGLQETINLARTPSKKSAELTATELSASIGPPSGAP